MFYKKVAAEMKGIFKSFSFYVMLGILVVMYVTQFSPPDGDDPLAPVPNAQDYDTNWVPQDDQNEISCAYNRMQYDLKYGVTAKYTWGFKNWTRLTTQQRDEIKKAMAQLSAVKGDYDAYQKILEGLNNALGQDTLYSFGNRKRLMFDTFYGSVPIENPKDKIKAGYLEIGSMLTQNQYTRQVFITNVTSKLTKAQTAALQEAELKISPKGLGEKGELTSVIDYEAYEKILDELDKRLGGGTVFSKEKRAYLHAKPMSYTEAQKQFEEITSKDQLTRAYGRVFADYMGITAGFYPVFIVLSLFIRDKRKKVNGKEAAWDVLAKFTAACLCILSAYMLIATHAAYIFTRISKNYGYAIDVWTFHKYTLLWIGPTILFVSALAILVYTLSKSFVLTIGTQFVVWSTSITTLGGDYRLFRCIIRFNELGEYSSYMNWQQSIMINRSFYVVLSAVILAAVVWISSKKIHQADLSPSTNSSHEDKE